VSREIEQRVVDEAAIFWNMASHEVIRELSHWAGAELFQNSDVWDNIGKRHFSFYRELCSLAGRTRPVRRILEWGPGGGANATAFAQEVDTFVAVDISEPNLEECIRQMARVGFIAEKKFVPVFFDISSPESVLDMVDEPVDFFLSTAVFQHFPSKSYGERVTRTAFELLAPGGIAIIQTREDDGSEDRRPKTENYVKNFASFTTYQPGEYRAIAENIGFSVLKSLIDNRLNYLYNFMFKP
jgi:cyclopropane fatty-acyl-phospholipid synthase-like methyltransferase